MDLASKCHYVCRIVERLENWKFSQVPTHRSVQASEASESKSILATIDLEKAGPPL